jgi:hypothetical protein
VTERTTRRWPGLKHIRRPRTRRGWLITIAASGAILALIDHTRATARTGLAAGCSHPAMPEWDAGAEPMSPAQD